MRYLLDTSVVIDFLRRSDKKATLLYRLAHENCCVSLITHIELFAGKSVWEHSKARVELESLFSDISVIPLDTTISETAGSIKAKHHGINLLDCIIAATAIHHGFTLVTLNTKDFSQIEGLTLYVSD